MKTKFCSIIVTHFAMSQERSDMMKASITSLIESTTYPFELIVVDNGGSKDDSRWLSYLSDEKKITTYLKNADNMHFAFARNQAFKLSHGDYICIADNDILYQYGWLNGCVNVLDDYPENRIYTTPMEYPMRSLNARYHKGYLEYYGEKMELNQRAGSNCFVIRREDYVKIGDFPHHRIGGSHWTNKAVRAGYLACVIPDLMVKDAGLRRGYNHKECLPIRKTLSNGHEIHFNEDEFKVKNPDKEYYA